MKKIVSIVITSVLLFFSSYCLSDSGIPNLVGTWSVKSEGSIMLKADKPGEKTHWENNQNVLVAEAKILEQNGRVIKGEFISAKATEKFIAVISIDNKNIYLADEDGTANMKIINKNTLETVYRHVTEKDTVVAIGIWKKKK